MGREIRRVPKGWEHPKDEKGDYKPLFDESYESAISEWIKGHNLWLKGNHSDQLNNPDATSNYKYYAEWEGNAPDVEYYRPKWSPKEATYCQVYETVSEGTPVTPAFATTKELIEYLIEHGDYWDQQRGSGGYSRESAEAFVKARLVLSMVMINGKIYRGIESANIGGENNERNNTTHNR